MAWVFTFAWLAALVLFFGAALIAGICVQNDDNQNAVVWLAVAIALCAVSQALSFASFAQWVQ